VPGLTVQATQFQLPHLLSPPLIFAYSALLRPRCLPLHLYATCTTRRSLHYLQTPVPVDNAPLTSPATLDDCTIWGELLTAWRYARHFYDIAFHGALPPLHHCGQALPPHTCSARTLPPPPPTRFTPPCAVLRCGTAPLHFTTPTTRLPFAALWLADDVLNATLPLTPAFPHYSQLQRHFPIPPPPHTATAARWAGCPPHTATLLLTTLDLLLLSTACR